MAMGISKIQLLQNGIYLIRFSNRSCKIRRFSGGTESALPDFPLENAYDILGVPEQSSFAEIKVSFRKLAKETHPDLSESKTTDSASCQRFVEILAAYEILSDPQRRRDYDQYLFSRRNIVHTNSREGRRLYTFESYPTVNHDMEVVEWLKWYRSAIQDIVYQRKVAAAGTGYFDELEQDFYSAIHAAYFGPEIETMDLLPDRFEAEERSTYETPEVLHLVSGRDLFGMVCLANNIPQLSTTYREKLGSSVSWGLDSCQSAENISIYTDSHEAYDTNSLHQQPKNAAHQKKSDAYKDLELHAFGKLVATATRVPAKSFFHGVHDEDKQQDHICVYLSSDYLLDPYKGSCGNGVINGALGGSRIPLGTITGLGTCPDEGTCPVYDSSGTETHMIMKHRTLLVKHMHWFGVGDKVSICECRCTRAKLPPSKFWLFEPRCGMHDIGGWYIETFGRDKKGRTVEAQRYWDGPDSSEQFDRRLHPAMYLLALAYRTLDIEEAARMRKSLRNSVDRHVFKFLSWCKKIV